VENGEEDATEGKVVPQRALTWHRSQVHLHPTGF
jgi:hypothetical protein